MNAICVTCLRQQMDGKLTAKACLMYFVGTSSIMCPSPAAADLATTLDISSQRKKLKK